MPGCKNYPLVAKIFRQTKIHCGNTENLIIRVHRIYCVQIHGSYAIVWLRDRAQGLRLVVGRATRCIGINILASNLIAQFKSWD